MLASLSQTTKNKYKKRVVISEPLDQSLSQQTQFFIFLKSLNFNHENVESQELNFSTIISVKFYII